MKQPKKSKGHYEVLIEGEFSASHYLRAYQQGQDEPMHGHNWKVQIQVNSPSLDNLGISVDFVAVRDMLRQELQHFDYKLINDLPAFQKLNPSSENVANHLFGRLDPRIQKEGGRLTRVTVWETHHSGASYVRS